MEDCYCIACVCDLASLVLLATIHMSCKLSLYILKALNYSGLPQDDEVSTHAHCFTQYTLQPIFYSFLNEN